MQDIKSNFGQLDAVVNCAGIAFAYRMYNSNKRQMADMDRYRKTMEVNVLGTINVIRHSIELMMDKKLEANQERGVVINTASVAAFDGQIGQVNTLNSIFTTKHKLFYVFRPLMPLPKVLFIR